MSTLSRIFNHIAAKFVAAPRLALSQKRKRLNNRKSELSNTQKIRRRGYYIVTKDDSTTHQKFGPDETEYLRKKEEKLKAEIQYLTDEVADLSRTVKLRATRSKNAFQEDQRIIRKKRLLKKEGRKVVSKVAKLVTVANVSEFTTLSEIVNASTDNAADTQNLLDFFSKNITEEYNKLNSNPALSEEVLKQTKKYLKEISK